jgi:hypothetical protein
LCESALALTDDPVAVVKIVQVMGVKAIPEVRGYGDRYLYP